MCAETVIPAVALFSGMLLQILVLLYFLFLFVYRCVNFVVVFGTVGTGGCGSVIGVEVVAGREPGWWVGKGLGEGAGKEQGEVAGKNQGRV